MPPPGSVSRLLEDIRRGDPAAADELLPRVYGELRRLARARLARVGPGLTLQPTALVHEPYVRLVEGQSVEWANRAHFFAAAAEAIRRILIDRARRCARGKHGGDSDLVLELTFTPRAGSGGEVTTVTHTVSAGVLQTSEDPLQTLFGFSGSEGRVGSVMITVTAGSASITNYSDFAATRASRRGWRRAAQPNRTQPDQRS